MNMHHGKRNNKSQRERVSGYCNRVMTGGFDFRQHKDIFSHAPAPHFRRAKWGRAL